MLGRYSMNDSVRVVLSTAANNSVTSLTFTAAVSPFNNPADPSGDAASNGIGIATLTDSLSLPTKFEIVTYTTLTNNGNGTYTISGVTRGVNGSSAQSWAVGAVLYQAVTKEGLMHPFLVADQTNDKLSVAATTLQLKNQTGKIYAQNTTGSFFSQFTYLGYEALTSNIGSQSATGMNSRCFAGGANANDSSWMAFCAVSSAVGPEFRMAKGRGTNGLTAVAVNDELGSVQWFARHASTGWANPARMVAKVASILGAAVKATVTMQLTPDGTSAPGDVVTYGHNGSGYTTQFTNFVGIGGTPGVAGAALMVYGSASVSGDLSVGTFYSSGAAIFDGGFTVAATANLSGATSINFGASNIRTSIASVSAPTATTNDWTIANFATAGRVRMTGAAGGTVTGLAGSSSWREVTLVNDGTGSVTLAHENASSTAANRFKLPSSASYVIAPNDSVTLWYDATNSRWRVMR